MNQFFSCDWGSSVFRLRLVDVADMSIRVEIKNHQGILIMHKLWKQSKSEDRLEYYLKFIHRQIRKIEHKLGKDLRNTPVIISGMASSSFGMVELPYKQLPFFTDGSDLEKYPIQSNSDFPYDCIIISGARTSDDVMRGEETLLVGSIHGHEGEEVFIFPGTHSKHVWVKDNFVVDLKTYMTGEFFELLFKKSILSDSVEMGGDIGNEQNMQSFEEGVRAGLNENILHASFLTRTNNLFAKYSKQANYHYLSGVLIGTEFRDITESTQSPIHIVCSKELKRQYEHAAKASGLKNSISVSRAKVALARGQFKIFSYL